MQDIRPEVNPFIKLIVPSSAGIALASAGIIPLFMAVVFLAVCLVMYWLVSTSIRELYFWFAVLFFFCTVSTINRPSFHLPQGVQLEMEGMVNQMPAGRDRWLSTTVTVYRWEEVNRNADPVANSVDSGTFGNRNENIMVYLDTATVYASGINSGDRVRLRAYLNPVDRDDGSYGRYMYRRGVRSSAFVRQTDVHTIPSGGKGIYVLSHRMQSAALAKLSRLDMPAGTKSIVTAMTAGDKRTVPKDIRAAYSLTGAAHVLAVSGLHVGIVFLLVNLVFMPLLLLRRGHILRNVVVVIVVWVYAMTAGLSPSVIRAAVMFTFGQIALASGSYKSALNIVLGSAVIMLAWNPAYIYDPGFLLSYAAVISILLFFEPLYSMFRTRWKVLNALISVIIVGITATVGTAPLVVYLFGNLPVVGIVINPAIILTANIIVICGVLYLVMPIPWLAPVFTWILDTAADFQNRLILWSAQQPYASVSVNMPLWMVIVCYLVLAGLGLWLNRGNESKELSLPDD